jgi:hypothetical protein
MRRPEDTCVALDPSLLGCRKDPDAFSSRLTQEIRRRVFDAERVAAKREAMLERLRARAAGRRVPASFYIGDDGSDEDIPLPQVLQIASDGRSRWTGLK